MLLLKGSGEEQSVMDKVKHATRRSIVTTSSVSEPHCLPLLERLHEEASVMDEVYQELVQAQLLLRTCAGCPGRKLCIRNPLSKDTQSKVRSGSV